MLKKVKDVSHNVNLQYFKNADFEFSNGLLRN